MISHAAMANVWHFTDDEKNKEVFIEYALWNRKMLREDVEIFNIFGHTITPKVDTTKHYINVDTGCYYVNEGYRKLSAYCIETNEVIL